MTTLVVVGLGIALLYVMGYRFDSQKRTIDQGGLIQVESRPPGAQIIYDSRSISGTTPRKINASAGAHTMRITREGYQPWQKTITVEAGGVHWLNYMLLVPEELESAAVRNFDTVADVTPVPNSDQMLVMESNQRPVFRLVRLDDKATMTTVELPTELRPTASGKYILHDWSSDGRQILIEHRQSKTSRWFVFNTRDASESVDVTAIVGENEVLKNVQFVASSDRVLYCLVDGAIRRVDIDNRTVSAPIVKDVSEYWQSKNGIVTYVSKHDAKTKTRELGYLTRDASKPRVIQTVYTDASTSLRMVIGTYQNRSYLAMQNADSISVNRVSLPRSDRDDALDMTNVAVINTENAVNDLSFSPNDRFIVAQHDATFMTYDIELESFTSTTLRGTEKVNQPITWLDRYHIWSSRDKQLRMYEFDGENVVSFGNVVSNLDPQLTRDSQFLYVFRPAEAGQNGVELTRISLRVD